METKPLLYGLIGFFVGGLLVSLAATTFDKPESSDASSMADMTQDLAGKRGDAYDRAFIKHMIVHHESAVDMAELSKTRAKHQEIRDLSDAIINAQTKEIDEMRTWQQKWGYKADPNTSESHMH